MDLQHLEGTGVALVTPFKKNLEIDFEALGRLLDFTAKGGVDYYVVQGTTGESATTSLEEKHEILDFVLKNNTHKLPVVYGLGGNDTRALVRQIQQTNLSDVAALLSVNPYYNKPSQNGIISHYKTMADASPVPLILYNVPGRTGSNMTAETTLELAHHPNIIGIKEASGNWEQILNILKNKPKKFIVISGDDLLAPAIYAMGGKGVISVLANAVPQFFQQIRKGHEASDWEKVQKATNQLLPLNPLMYEESNPVGIKAALKILGICEDYVRLPLVPASKALSNKIATQIKI